MDANTILAWARVWNLVPYSEIPKFVWEDLVQRADIRVQFSSNYECVYNCFMHTVINVVDTGGNWSSVGRIEVNNDFVMQLKIVYLYLGFI